MLVMWEWIQEHGPDVKSLISWKNQVMGALAALIALGVLQTAVSVLTLMRG